MNNELAQAYLRLLAPPRRRALGRTSTTVLEPWWWPAGDGRTLTSWGLPQDRHYLLQSLRGGSSLTAPNLLYKGFCGSVGVPKGSCDRWVFSSRPSSGRYPSRTTSGLAKLLTRLQWSETTHVCDAFKFRGLGPDRQADELTTHQTWRTSIELLEAEYLLTRPKVILVAGRKAQEWMHVQLPRYASSQGVFINELRSRAEHVISWMAHVPATTVAEDWRRGMAKKKGSLSAMT